MSHGTPIREAAAELRSLVACYLPTRHVSAFRATALRLNRTIAETSPFTPVLGLARSLLAVGALLTLLFTPLDQMFFRSKNFPTGIVCQGLAERSSLFCVIGDDSLPLARIVAVAILVTVIIGVLPAVTGLLHWWVVWSMYSSSPIPDGGDHVAGALTLLLIPLLVLDRRRTHWQVDHRYDRRNSLTKSLAYAVLALIWIQVAGIYAHAAIAKLGVEEWANGTALWYWIQDPTFAPGEPVLWVMQAVTGTMVGVLVLTYGSLALESALMLGLFAPLRIRGLLWVLGLSFHFGIGVVFGLWSFFCSMSAALTLYLIRPVWRATPEPVPADETDWKRSGQTGEEATRDHAVVPAP